ncbi:hypothetical protein ACLOJK_002244 [Asimina triloba]
MPNDKADVSLLPEKNHQMGEHLLGSYMVRDQNANLSFQQCMVGAERSSMSSWKVMEQDLGSRSKLIVQPASLFLEGNKGSNGPLYENMRISSNDMQFSQSINTVSSRLAEDEPFESLEEIEAQTIGNLLPDDDDLLSGVIDDLEYLPLQSTGDDIELDLFSSGGGMELEADDALNHGIKCSDFSGGIPNAQQGGANSPFAGEHPYGEHPSRTLFVRNINSNVEDSELRMLFETYGDIRTLYTACKHRGFVMISYYDIRAARNAMRALQNKPLRRRKLDIHFSIPKENPSEKDVNQGTLVVFNLDPSVTNDDLRQIFGAYGEIKEIRETPHKRHHKFIEFYDVRAAEGALRALNRSDIAGKRIKLEPSRPGGARRWYSPNKLALPFPTHLMQQLSPELEDDDGGCQQPGSPPNSSPSGGFEYHDGLVNAITYNSPSTISAMAASINSRPADAVDNRHINRVGSGGPSNGHSFELNEGGSAPAVNPSLWDRRSAYAGHSAEASAFHPGSLGSMGFSGGLDLTQHNIFPHVAANSIDPSLSSSHVGLPSPQQRCHMFPSRNPMIAVANSVDAPNEQRVRSRRNEANSNQADNKKQFELDIERILRGEDSRTTLMIKNIPNKYTSKMLLAAIDENHRGTYDFIYLPIDFKNKCNVGYAFINMIDPKRIVPFFQAFNGKKWEKFNSEKVASLAYARIQGKSALIAHFQNSSLMNEDKRCRPILFHSDGPNAGDQEPFPMGVNIRSRPGKTRTQTNEDNHQGSPSSGEESTGGNGAGFSSGVGKESGRASGSFLPLFLGGVLDNHRGINVQELVSECVHGFV